MSNELSNFEWSDDETPSFLSPDPESITTFRLARLLLLLQVARETGRPITSLDRLGYYEFFADSPYLVVAGERRADKTDAMELELAGFSRNQLAYASTGQRFASRRRRLQHDLARLVSYNLVSVNGAGYIATDGAAEIADRLRSSYAHAYRISSKIVLRRLTGMSNRALDSAVESWIGGSGLLLDFLDDVTDTEAPALNRSSAASNRTRRKSK